MVIVLIFCGRIHMNDCSHVKSLSISPIHHQPGTSRSAHLAIHHSPDSTIFISDSSIFQSSDFTPTVRPDPASHHHNSVPDPPQLYLTLNTTILLDLIYTFYRSDLLFILSESPSPKQQQLHDNSSLIQPAAVCSFRWFSGRFCVISMIEFCITQNE